MNRKNHAWQRICKKATAALLAGCMLATASIYQAPAATAAVGNILKNSTFEDGIAHWNSYIAGGASASIMGKNGQLQLNVKKVGTLNYGVQVYYDIIPLYTNGVYRLRYDISSSVKRDVEAMVQQNGGTYQAYTWKQLSLTSTPQSVDVTFTMKAESDRFARLVFNCGNEGEELDAHEIYFDNVYLELIDDSKVDYSVFEEPEAPILTNQLGYQTDSVKQAVLRQVTTDTEFDVVDTATDKSVYTGKLSAPVQNKMADETNWIADFSAVTEPGTYCIRTAALGDSYPFTIRDTVYTDLLNESVYMLYLQRCGVAVEDSVVGHQPCHNTLATLYGTNEKIDVSGGWHDAGDYGRYVVAGAKAIADLVFAYEKNPALYPDNTGIPESGNGCPDILDEVRFEAEWMLKMQDAKTGGVHHKVTCAEFPGYVAPCEETEPLIVTPVSTTATADFAAVMAMMYEQFADRDAAFAKTCLDAAKSAWGFLQQNPNLIFKNPEDIVTGSYEDTSDRDERYWAAAQLYRATGDSAYGDAFAAMVSQKVSDNLDWGTLGDYGNLAYLGLDASKQDSKVAEKIKASVLSRADDLVALGAKNPYGVSVSTFNWGSNMTIANNGILLNLASELSGDQTYANAAKEQLNYLLGKNAVGTCFVTGYGTVSPKTPHHRPSMAANAAMRGMLVGGVNENLEDSAAEAFLGEKAPAKCYIDNAESYSTNEITIYWNSPLVFLLTDVMTDQGATEQPLVGDLDGNGTLDAADVKLLNDYLVRRATLSADALALADVNGDQTVNALDGAALKQLILNK